MLFERMPPLRTEIFLPVPEPGGVVMKRRLWGVVASAVFGTITPSKVTMGAVPKLLPSMVTCVPPAMGPFAGEILLMSGAV
jgi:hypothetical protein